MPHISFQEAIDAALAFDFQAVGSRQVARSLERETLSLEDLGALLSPAAAENLEDLAARSRDLTLRHFGLNVTLFTPLYLANHCVNHCLYCGFSALGDIRRGALTESDVDQELAAIEVTGLEDVLLLTGDSRARSGPEYIFRCAALAAKRLKKVGLEVYPLSIREYSRARDAGVDYVCVYQETYEPNLYAHVHLKGPKRNYAWRLAAPERALAAGVRGVGLGALLGLGDFRRDVLALGWHALYLSRLHPQAEISFSVPRLRPAPGHVVFQQSPVSEAELAQIIMALRIFMPWAGISLSTRERPFFRDHLVGLGATRLSAGVRTSVGGHSGPDHGEEQFFKSDPRNVPQVCQALAQMGFQAVFNDYIRL
ncbi:MAG: 2-iminoacetate synthase ThiH [Deltaproteobacteria bacterium]|jgi:2-iminoacetate synthase|nr:2-iminoacetate synthase ThiH [Deltaproteobacteria bacterium]